MLRKVPLLGIVALRKESVDRNAACTAIASKSDTSLSARRAWIEIERPTRGTPNQYVALRKESVDRNFSFGLSCADTVVALRKESVDRNNGKA